MKTLDYYWYSKNLVSLLLLPLSWLFRLLSWLRQQCYKLGLCRIHRLPVPVIIIGNISVGGTGKTPLTIWLVKLLQQAGYRPGIVSRGYRGKANSWPQQVRVDSDPVMVGDEAVLLAQRCQCPIAVGPERALAAQALLKYNDCDIIIADDGLQHYALGRDIEIVVIDGIRRFGNGRSLPAGPLREPVAKLNRFDFVVVNKGCVMKREFQMTLQAEKFYRVNDSSHVVDINDLCSGPVHAVAGIGHPQRFFTQLEGMGIDVIKHAFPDHHIFSATDLNFNDDLAIIMTEKDAVKCRRFVADHVCYLSVTAEVDGRMATQLLARLDNIQRQLNINNVRTQHG